MFDLTSSKLLILGLVALIVVGPKDLPVLLRTLGRYLGMIRRQAAEFRAQFDEAMRDAEMDDLRKEVNAMHDDMTKSLNEAQGAVSQELAAAQRDVDAALGAPEAPAQPAITRAASDGPGPGGAAEAGDGKATQPADAGGEAGSDKPHTVAESLPKPPVMPHPGIQDMKSGA